MALSQEDNALSIVENLYWSKRVVLVSGKRRQFSIKREY